MANTQKDYIATAAILADRSLKLGDSKLAALAGRFADMYAKDNPRFKRDLFMKACGVDAFYLQPTKAS